MLGCKEDIWVPKRLLPLHMHAIVYSRRGELANQKSEFPMTEISSLSSTPRNFLLALESPPESHYNSCASMTAFSHQFSCCWSSGVSNLTLNCGGLWLKQDSLSEWCLLYSTSHANNLSWEGRFHSIGFHLPIVWEPSINSNPTTGAPIYSYRGRSVYVWGQHMDYGTLTTLCRWGSTPVNNK